jgi:hypothetical protein
VTPPEETAPTRVVQATGGRLAEALMFSAAVLVPAWFIGRGSDAGPVIYGIGLVVAVLVFVAFLRPDPRVVSDHEIRLRRKTIRRADVVRVTRSAETTALAFRGPDGSVVALHDPMGQYRPFRDALREHGWPEVELQA